MSSRSKRTRSPGGRAYAGQSSHERAGARRASFVDAGVRVFGREGFRGATVKGLCREAGLTERYFYESFANSEALFAEVYKTLVAALEKDLSTAVESGRPDPQAMTRAGLEVFFERMSDPLIARVLLIEIFGINNDIDRTYRAATYNFARITEELIGGIFDFARLPAADSRLVALGLIGSTIHIAMYWTLNNYRDSRETVIESSLALYNALAQQLASPNG